MSYKGPKPQHRNAIQAVNEARQHALQTLSVYRSETVDLPHQNLAPAGGEPQLAVECSQRAVDYFMQLRPYRAASKSWNAVVTDIQLPKTIDTGTSARLGQSNRPNLRICRQPRIEINNMTELLETINQDVVYSTNFPMGELREQTPSLSQPELTTVRLPSGEFEVRHDAAQQFLAGNLTAADIKALGTASGDSDDEDEDEFIPATPSVQSTPGDTRGRDGRLERFKIVFGPDKLIRLIEAADEIAAEMDLLAELENPREQDQGGL